MSTNSYTPPLFVRILMLTLVVAAVLGAIFGEWSTIFVSLATLGLMLYGIHLSQQIAFRFPHSFVTAAIIFIYATLFLGEVGNFYERYWWWDKVLHMGSAIEFGLIGFTVLLLLFRSEKIGASPFLISVFAFSFALAIGGLWEVFEFTMDQIFGLAMQKSGLVDTMWDLIIDTIGALIASSAGYFYLIKPKAGVLSKFIGEMIRMNLTARKKLH